MLESVSYNSLLDAAGATLLRMNLIMYSGNALIATMTATFQAKRDESTKDKSRGRVCQEHINKYISILVLTEVLW